LDSIPAIYKPNVIQANCIHALPNMQPNHVAVGGVEVDLGGFLMFDARIVEIELLLHAVRT
jgi:hypothetical protein